MAIGAVGPCISAPIFEEVLYRGSRRHDAASMGHSYELGLLSGYGPPLVTLRYRFCLLFIISTLGEFSLCQFLVSEGGGGGGGGGALSRTEVGREI
eukprot:767548-Hanusia_phi.AAC.9